MKRPQSERGAVPLLPVLAMAGVVVASNILVQFLLGPWLTWGALTYPLAFLVTDLTLRLYGARIAQRVMLAGFAVGLLCSLIGTQIMGPEGPLVSLRVAIGSGIAFLAAQSLDIAIFRALRARAWWVPPLLSSLIGGAIDTALFFSIAFSATLTPLFPTVYVGWANEGLPLLGLGPTAPLWVSLAVADFAVKTGVALIALLPFWVILGGMRRAP